MVSSEFKASSSITKLSIEVAIPEKELHVVMELRNM
jgi:hypothetical protein